MVLIALGQSASKEVSRIAFSLQFAFQKDQPKYPSISILLQTALLHFYFQKGEHNFSAISNN